VEAALNGETLTPFTPIEQLESLRDDLRTKLQALEQDDEDLVRPHFSNHLAEDAQDQQQIRSDAAVRQVVLDDLRRVEHALSRALDGKYGLCEDCGHEIPPRRLQVIPSATLCVACQSRRETRYSVH
jgi:DnaK suppressor protein